MWCVTCKSDVAAGVSPDTGRVQCATCGAELAQANGIRERTKDAREILERWSNKSMMDPYGPVPGSRSRPSEKMASAIGDSEPVSHAVEAEHETTPQPRTRSHSPAGNRDETNAGITMDTPSEPVQPQRRRTPRAVRIDRPTKVREVADAPDRVRGHRRPVTRHFDEPHGQELRGPHFEMAPPKQPSWAVTTGQWLAYIGVLALTIGTAVVVYGHFGGYSNYTPTGWLITTVGQMLLFLGVINLVSGGMEQSNEEVTHRIEVLGERLLRLQANTEQALRGPSIPAERYAEGEISETESVRAYAPTESAETQE